MILKDRRPKFQGDTTERIVLKFISDSTLDQAPGWEDVRQWLNSKCTGRFQIENLERYLDYQAMGFLFVFDLVFDNPSDAVLFKLTWSK